MTLFNNIYLDERRNMNDVSVTGKIIILAEYGLFYLGIKWAFQYFFYLPIDKVKQVKRKL